MLWTALDRAITMLLALSASPFTRQREVIVALLVLDRRAMNAAKTPPSLTPQNRKKPAHINVSNRYGINILTNLPLTLALLGPKKRGPIFFSSPIVLVLPSLHLRGGKEQRARKRKGKKRKKAPSIIPTKSTHHLISHKTKKHSKRTFKPSSDGISIFAHLASPSILILIALASKAKRAQHRQEANL
jgi:hypothetical protein